MNKHIAFVLGNGQTRSQVDCNSLLGNTYGCNRLYQDFTPSVLVSTDKGIATEIQKSGYSKNNTHYTRKEYILKDSGAIALPSDVYGMSSGPACLGLACKEHYEKIFMIGMDLKGINNKHNNIYAGTEHYKSKDSAATPYTNWQLHIGNLIKDHPHILFFQVNPLDNFTPEEWKILGNFKVINNLQREF